MLSLSVRIQRLMLNINVNYFHCIIYCIVIIVSCNMNFNLFDAIFLFFVGGK